VCLLLREKRSRIQCQHVSIFFYVGSIVGLVYSISGLFCLYSRSLLPL
jgi:hypothetical protein